MVLRCGGAAFVTLCPALPAATLDHPTIDIARKLSDTRRLPVDLDLLLRTPLTAELLRIVVSEQGQWTAEELSDVTGAPYPTVTRELRRLQKSGVLAVEVVGRTKLLSLQADDAMVRALARTVALGPGPKGGDMAKKKGKKKDSKKKGKKK